MDIGSLQTKERPDKVGDTDTCEDDVVPSAGDKDIMSGHVRDEIETGHLPTCLSKYVRSSRWQQHHRPHGALALARSTCCGKLKCDVDICCEVRSPGKASSSRRNNTKRGHEIEWEIVDVEITGVEIDEECPSGAWTSHEMRARELDENCVYLEQDRHA